MFRLCLVAFSLSFETQQTTFSSYCYIIIESNNKHLSSSRSYFDHTEKRPKWSSTNITQCRISFTAMSTCFQERENSVKQPEKSSTDLQVLLSFSALALTFSLSIAQTNTIKKGSLSSLANTVSPASIRLTSTRPPRVWQLARHPYSSQFVRIRII